MSSLLTAHCALRSALCSLLPALCSALAACCSVPNWRLSTLRSMLSARGALPSARRSKLCPGLKPRTAPVLPIARLAARVNICRARLCRRDKRVVRLPQQTPRV